MGEKRAYSGIRLLVTAVAVLLICFLALGGANALSNNSFINGTVMDSVNKTGIYGVTVSTNTGFSTTTDATGFYSFDVAAGSYEFTAKRDPTYYMNNTISISTIGNETILQDIELLKKPVGTITGKVTVFSELLPDPITVAPPLDSTVATDIATATEFLYNGSNPIQEGVAPGTIEARRVAVLRGQVFTIEGTPLSGVNISILYHPELGSTLTRADGMFDMAVNGGGLLTVNYEKAGYLTAQRQLNAPWRDYAWLPDIVLIHLDSHVTAINLSSNIPIQMARSTSVTDADGTRQETLLFPQGISANITLPDGRTQALTSFHVRATEYTVGPDGPKAMPAELPPTSGYTYAVEFSIDEVPDVAEVSFDNPVYSYMENFLNFSAGSTVPVGYYNRSLGQWIPSDNGRVIKILNITDGLANLDIDGINQSANASQLAFMNITDDERQQLALIYQSNQSLWRVPVKHFSPWDKNWGIRCLNDICEPPGQSLASNTINDPDCQGGSIIECQTQTLGEAVGVIGTPFSLNYKSDRVQGRIEAYSLDIPLTGPNILPELKSIGLLIYVAGKNFKYGFFPEPNKKFTFIWDGKDAYNRTVQGSVPIHVQIGYEYEMEYKMTDRFGYNGGGQIITGDPARNRIILWQDLHSMIGTWNTKDQLMGGWRLNEHHSYDPVGRVLYLGNGRKLSAEGMDLEINTGAGTGQMGYSGDGGQATQAKISYPKGVAIGPDGSLFIVEGHHIRKVRPDGNITTVAGINDFGYSGDGGPATQARLSSPQGVTVGPDGSIYIADSGNHRIRWVRPDGNITTIAGTGIGGYSGDGSPAIQAKLNNPNGVAVGPDGSIYIADSGNNRIRQISPDGTILTVAGGGNPPPPSIGDGGPATMAKIYPYGVTVGPDGSIYIADSGNNRIRRVSPDGKIRTIAGGGNPIPPSVGDGLPAINAMIDPYGVALGSDGSIYIADTSNHRIRRVSPDGNITTVAGNGSSNYGGDGGLSNQATLSYPRGIAVSQEGIYIADSVNHRIRQVTQAMHGYAISDIAIPSDDGSGLYQFNGLGLHLRTFDALTGALHYQFTYDSANLLIAVTDGDGNVVTIERDSTGNATAIISPDGQRTGLIMDNNGYLAEITNPAGESVRMTYTNDGLLTNLINPRGNTYNFSYDVFGRLIRDENPAGGFKTLLRTEMADNYSVTLSTGLNRNTTYQVERLSTGELRRVNTFPSGLKTETIIGTDGGRLIHNSDGVNITTIQGPDPRFGMRAPVLSKLSLTTPSGLTGTMNSEKTATLANTKDLLSVQDLTKIVNINGRTFTSTYNATWKNITTRTPLGRTATITLDNKGRVIEGKIPGIVPVNITYDARGRLSTISQGTRNVSLSYDPQGNLKNFTDPLTRSVEFEYDTAGRVTTQTLPDGRQIRYSYDSNGNMVSVSPPERPDHTFNYTPVDLMKDYLPPDLGGPRTTHYSYNIDRQLTSVMRPDGDMIDLSYDSAGRLSTITYPQGTTSLAYNSTTGNLKIITAPDGGTITYAYDGSLLLDTNWSGTVSGSIHRTYDNNFRITSESVNGNTVNFQYDQDGFLTQAGSLTLSNDPQNGLYTGGTLGTITDTLSYNSFREVAAYQAAFGSTRIFLVNYTHDDIGRIVSKIETIDGATNIFNYSYDTTGHLTNVSKDGIMISQYMYDANGNRLSYTSPGGTISGTYDNQDRLMQYGTTTYAYTANGELLSKTNGSQTTTYNYDAMGNLRNVTLPDGMKIEYLIDGQNRRIGKKVNGILVQGFLWESKLRIAAELDGNGNVVSRFVYGTKINVPEFIIKGGTTYRIITDHLGSPRLVLNVSDGTIFQRIEYDAWGNVLSDTNPGFQPFGFAGGLYDRDSKLIRFGVRDYDTDTGRWTTKDPILFGGGDTNLYGYVLNAPVNLLDAKGLEIEITVINTGDYVGWLAAATRIGEIEMTDVNNMVDNVLNEAGNEQISELNILDHGNNQQIMIGTDIIDSGNLPLFANQLMRLRGHFADNGYVILGHCDIGQNIDFIMRLSNILGVPVYAGTGKSNPVYRFNFGNYARCDSFSCSWAFHLRTLQDFHNEAF